MNFNYLFLNLKIPLIVCEAKSQKIVYINPEAKALLGANKSGSANTVSGVLNPVSAEELDGLMQKAADKGYVSGFVLSLKNERLSKVKINAYLLSDDERYICFYLFNENKDEEELTGEIVKKLSAGMNAAVTAMERVIDNIDAMVFAVDTKTNLVVYMNNAMARERGIKDKENEQIFCYQMFMRDVTEPCSDCPCKQLLTDEGKPGGKAIRSEILSTINNKWYSMSSVVVEWINGEYVYLKSAVEITDRKHNEDILIKSAQTDAMTNVYNREWGYKALDKLITDVKDQEGSSSVIFIDIDGLKRVNDNYGHIEGDKIIVGVVDALKKSTRKNDIISRWGGDEFVVLLPGCTKTNAEAVMISATSLLDEINKISVKPYKYSFSFGIYEITGGQKNHTSESIIEMADSLMYEQKNKKKQAMAAS